MAPRTASQSYLMIALLGMKGVASANRRIGCQHLGCLDEQLGQANNDVFALYRCWNLLDVK